MRRLRLSSDDAETSATRETDESRSEERMDARSVPRSMLSIAGESLLAASWNYHGAESDNTNPNL